MVMNERIKKNKMEKVQSVPEESSDVPKESKKRTFNQFQAAQNGEIQNAGPSDDQADKRRKIEPVVKRDLPAFL